ncbi:MAG: sugar phosphate nucleotidyltransferase [Steroidobacteraceae bacterium]
MKTLRMTWALVLAGGDGTRLAALTRDGFGNQVPKQFCSLSGGQALVHDAVQRARYVAPRERTCVIVAEQHQRYWKRQLWALGTRNVIKQPRNCGTAIGILLAVLHIVRRDPMARIVFLPADHHVRDEAALGLSLREAVTLVTDAYNDLILVGIEPEGADSDLGYIVPGASREDGARGIARFVEKPDSELARKLLASGAVWNSFIFAGAAATLLDLLRESIPRIVDDVSSALAGDARHTDGLALHNLYAKLPSVDFSRSVLEGAESRLRLLTVPACGWTDLGTPSRVAAALHKLNSGSTATSRPRNIAVPGFLSLAEQTSRFMLARA